MKTDEIRQQEPEIREEFPGTLGKLLGMGLIRNGGVIVNCCGSRPHDQAASRGAAWFD
jgi:hypothetical protein